MLQAACRQDHAEASLLTDLQWVSLKTKQCQAGSRGVLTVQLLSNIQDDGMNSATPQQAHQLCQVAQVQAGLDFLHVQRRRRLQSQSCELPEGCERGHAGS